MKITICGSIAFIKEMYDLLAELERMGHEVQAPPNVVPTAEGDLVDSLEYYKLKKTAPDRDHPFWKTHPDRIRNHFEKVAWADAILVVNYDKNGVAGYVGPNTLMEMGVAFFLKKPVYILNPIPEELPWREELLGLQPIVINNDLSEIK